MSEEAISAQFEIIRVQIMQSGAVRVVLEASEDRTDLLKTFADIRRGGGIIEAAMLPIHNAPKENRFING